MSVFSDCTFIDNSTQESNQTTLLGEKAAMLAQEGNQTTLGFTIKAIAALAVSFGVFVYLISDHWIGLFTKDPQFIQMGSSILHVTFLSLFITGMATLFTGIFQATAQGTAAFVRSVFQGITLIPVPSIADRLNGFHG